MKPRLRFAPSPTGYVHIGGLRTALYNFLYAKQQEGTYLLRIEDTDQTRLVEDAIEGIIKSLTWAGVTHDEGPMLNEINDGIVEKGDFGPYIQSNRLEIYKKHALELVESGHAYYCFCSKERLESVREKQKSEGATPKYDGHCKTLTTDEINAKLQAGEDHVIRLKLPVDRVIEFNDAIKGHVSVNTNDLDDQVLMKTDGFPTYHMAVVVDDHYMGITHVVRGDEWLISTPKHVYTYEAFGWDAPEFVHLPVILSHTKKKLSKREGSVAVEDFRQKGYLPEALINYIALVGWSPEDGQEIMSMADMIEKFSFERVSKSSGVFDLDKLNWMNNHYIKSADLDVLTGLCKPYLIESGFATEDNFDEKYTELKRIVEVLRERFDKLEDVKSYYTFFTRHDVELEDDEAREIIALDHVPEIMNLFIEKMMRVEKLDADAVKAILKEIQKETGYKGKNLFMPARVAITGQVHGPDIAIVTEILGKELTKERIEFCLANHCN
ncbi:glutamate--tRNA ligase [Fusibacter bizertensis]|jgi:glutamyl-tRNA synthetase, bacterial family|uniref:Glutamate--tRNA ligase n=1 Tax=Fusibacter bizertensis TaxID=1488331 RepID=A0ABT6NHK1_9FIRM|nr:glutamate--tRNA ligase [Fusibacter bizertensis]MDH8679886.1 glutamate--tRNA ligase [Fusibacter bizertensis]